MTVPRETTRGRRSKRQGKSSSTPEAPARFEGILLVHPEAMEIPTRLYRGRKDLSQFGALLRWIASLDNLTFLELGDRLEVDPTTLYRASTVAHATIGNVFKVVNGVRSYLGNEQFLLFDRAWKLAQMRQQDIPELWKEDAEAMATVLKRVWRAFEEVDHGKKR